MKQVKVTEFRAHLPEYLGKVQDGETITLVSRGRPIAQLVPVTGVVEQARQQIAALRKHARIGDVLSPADVEWKATNGRS